MMKMNKILLIVAALVSVSICAKTHEQKVVEFVRHLTEHSKDGDNSVEYWAERITKVASEHKDEAEALRMNGKLGDKLIKELKKDIVADKLEMNIF